MPNILFRADAEKTIGVGDLKSLIYLACEFRKNGWETFFIVRDYEPALNIIKKHSLKNACLIPKDLALESEFSFIRKSCEENNIDCLFMEITKHNLLEYASLGKPAPLKGCVNFDGIITEDFDLVVNWNVGSSDKLYENFKGKNTRFILGFENTVIPDNFDWERISGRGFSKEVRRILVSMGGIDEFDLTGRIIKALLNKKEIFEVRIILGPGYGGRKQLENFAASYTGKIMVRENPDSLLEDYLWADLAFSAGGLTSSELVASRTPAILVSSYAHQIKRCEYFSGNKLAYYAGFHSDIDEEKILKGLDALMKNINSYRNNLADFNLRGGNERIFKDVYLKIHNAKEKI